MARARKGSPATPRAAPWSRAKQAERVTATSDAWAAEIERRLEAAAHDGGQRDFYLDPSRLITARVGRGGGKTSGELFRLIRVMARKRKARCVYITLSRPLAEEIAWEPLKALIDQLGIEATFNESKLRCRFKKTGSTLRLVGADDKKEVNKLRGQPFDEVAIDECSSFPRGLLDELVERVIEPRIGQRKGVIVLLSTPGTTLAGLYYDTTRPGSPSHRPYAERDKPEYAGWRGWSSHWWSLAHPAAQKIEALRNLWSDAIQRKADKGWSDENPVWKREYLGIWAADETDSIFKYRPHLDDGAPWNEWDPPMERRAELLEFGALEIAELPPGPDGKPRTDWLFAVALDHGARDPFACNAFAASPSDPTRTVHHVFAFERTGMYARAIAVLLLGPQALTDINAAHELPGGLIGALGGWPAGMVADTAQLGANILLELLQVYGIKILPAEQKGKYAAIELVNGDFFDGRIKILKGSPLAQQLGELQWQKDEYGFPRENKAQANHSTDCLVYARRELANIFDAIGEQPDPAVQRRSAAAAARGAPNPDPSAGRGEFDALFGDGPGSFDSLFGSGSVDWGNL